MFDAISFSDFFSLRLLAQTHLFITLKMPLAKKPVASPFSGLFETRKNSSFSKDANALIQGGKGIRTVCSPSNKSILKRKRRSAVPILTGLQDGDFYISAKKEKVYAEESKAGIVLRE